MKPHLDVFVTNSKIGQFLGSPALSEPIKLPPNIICEDCGWAIPKPDRYFEWMYCPVCGKVHKDSRLK